MAGTPSTGTANSDPLEHCIIDLVNAMKADFGNRFKTQFSNTEELRQYKRRLYAKLRGLPVRFIYDAYESYIDGDPEWPPAVPEIVRRVLVEKKADNKRQEEQAENERKAALPPPGKTQCDPLKLLSEAKAKVDEKCADDNDAWVLRKAELLRNHNAVLTLHHGRIAKYSAKPEQECAVPGCYRVGSITPSTNGSSNWYCKEHFRR